MKKITLILTILLSLLLVSCNKENKTYDIVTSSFFEQDIVSNIAKDKLSYKTLTKPGVDLHDFRPTSKEMNHIKQSKLFIFTSYNIHHWLNNNVNSLIGDNTSVLNLNDYNNLNYEDSHYWTDPYLILDFILLIKDEIIKIDNDNEEFYTLNANNYYNKIKDLINDFEMFINSKEDINIYFAGHNSMYYFEKRFNLSINSLSNTNKPDADLTSKQILSLLNEIKKDNIHYLYIEELIEPKIAKTIQRELLKENYELTLLTLHSYHNISKEDSKNNVTYYDLLKQNIINIKKGVN